MPEMKGGCLCGQVRYTANAEPIFVGVCHCTSCQKQSGTAFNVVVAVPQPALSIQGAPKSYTKKGDSGNEVISRFCSNCGSTILSEPAVMPGVSILRVGTLDDPSWVKPSMEISCEPAQASAGLGVDVNA